MPGEAKRTRNAGNISLVSGLSSRQKGPGNTSFKDQEPETRLKPIYSSSTQGWPQTPASICLVSFVEFCSTILPREGKVLSPAALKANLNYVNLKLCDPKVVTGLNWLSKFEKSINPSN